ncbi:aegerolysin family protein [Oceanirhabdus seepicola]|uniref:Uncharacterized protein n=1 Tax=Oceanirhabdus seepicola TaxID=2828781 RepID=A0A9J6P891_9CLOT|nr:aegerolysin family protein [Oceanirhabdus seepicola]MCM1992129.1 hypothetical protein [Oceanirhabdus seepicola]
MHYNDCYDETFRDINDLFTRESNITIRNNLNTTLMRTNVKLKSGHFRKGTWEEEELPGSIISSGDKTTFSVNNEGISYVNGPEGSVTYTTATPLKGVDNPRIVISWNNPLGTEQSTYVATSYPSELIKHTLYPPVDALDGWNQNIEIVISET